MNESDEASSVSSGILTGLTKGMHFRDHAVLYRTNAQSNALERSFQQNGIPYRIIGGMRFFDRAEVKDMLAYLCLIQNTTDDLRLRRIINLPARGIGGKTMETVERQATAAGIPIFDVVSDPKGYPSLEKSAGKLLAFSGMILSLREDAKTMSLPDFYDQVLRQTGYLAMLESRDDPENQTRKENVLELKSSLIEYAGKTDTPTLGGFLEEVSLYTDIERYDREADAAVMMTMHSAKGLEFPVVFLVGMEEEIFPGNRIFSDPDQLEEERRLCYVAITRAKRKLFVSYARQRMLYGRTTYGRASRFLQEIPPDCITGMTLRQKTREKETYRTERPAAAYARPAGSRPVPKPHSSAPLPEIKKGDQIEHTAFGPGLVLSVMPMSGDALLEVAFEKVGTKKLMLKHAGAHLKKKS